MVRINTSEDEILILLPYSDGMFRLEMLEDVVRQMLDWSLAYFTVKDTIGDWNLRTIQRCYLAAIVNHVTMVKKNRAVRPGDSLRRFTPSSGT